MGKSLIIVESPSKAKTIKIPRQEFEVDASGGHIRDLPENGLGINIKNNFQPTYVVNPSKREVVKRLSEKAKKAESVYLATDPDREGEAISWHLAYLLGIPPESKSRIVFNEISKRSVTKALEAPREININLVNAQQARRVLDRLVGYKLSPLLCRRIQNRLSAGRVQSVALRLIVEREQEIQNFSQRILDGNHRAVLAASRRTRFQGLACLKGRQVQARKQAGGRVLQAAKTPGRRA